MNGVEMQGAADPAAESTEMAGGAGDVAENRGAGAARTGGGTAGMTDNQRWAVARKRAEREAQERFAAQAQEYDALMDELRAAGLQGSPAEIARAVRAQRESGRQARQPDYRQEQERFQQALAASPDVQQARKIVQQRTYETDLGAVKAAYPEVEAQDITELGSVFLELMAAAEQGGKHLDPVVAYEAQMAYDRRNNIAPPPSTGSARGDAAPEKEYYSSSELDRLTSRQLDDPSVMARAMKSLRRLRK